MATTFEDIPPSSMLFYLWWRRWQKRTGDERSDFTSRNSLLRLKVKSSIGGDWDGELRMAIVVTFSMVDVARPGSVPTPWVWAMCIVPCFP